MQNLTQQTLIGIFSATVMLGISVLGYMIFSHERKWSFETNPYIVLDDLKTINVLMLEGSFRKIPKIDGVWTPNPEDIESLEKAIYRLDETTFDSHLGPKKLAKPVREYYRQYLGVTYRGKNLIYINAFGHTEYLSRSLEQLELRGKDNQMHWSHCGNHCWGGLFNPRNHEFSEPRVDIN